MKSFPFKKIDAFTKGLSTGNPCACIYLKSPGDITDQEMQQIAAELKGFVNEVVYLFPEEKDFIKIRVKDAYLNVYNKIKESDSVFITAPAPKYNNLRLKKEEIAQALKIGTEGINDNFKKGENRNNVIFGGAAVVKIEGTYTLSSLRTDL